MLSTATILPLLRLPPLWPPSADSRLAYSLSSTCAADEPGCWRASEPAAGDKEPSSGSASLRCGLQQHRAKAHCFQEARVSAAARGKHKSSRSPISKVSTGEVDSDDIDVISKVNS